MRSYSEISKRVIWLFVVIATLFWVSIASQAQQSTTGETSAAPTKTNLPSASATAGGAVSSLTRSPFKSLRGSWRGSGLVKLEEGKTEQIGCKAYYRVKQEGKRLGMSIICASKANKINLKAELDLGDAGSVSGTWEERTFNATGNAIGQASNTSMRLKIDGSLDGTVSIILDGKTQQVSIYSDNEGLNGVTIRLRRI